MLLIYLLYTFLQNLNLSQKPTNLLFNSLVLVNYTYYQFY